MISSRWLTRGERCSQSLGSSPISTLTRGCSKADLYPDQAHLDLSQLSLDQVPVLPCFHQKLCNVVTTSITGA